MGIAPARVAAYEALRRVTRGECDLPQGLAATRSRLADDRDRTLAAEILTGTERWRNAIDFLIERYAGRPLSQLDEEVVDILRLGAYQLLHLDRVPASAVVSDAVDLARRAAKTSAGGLVNAVLRRFSQERRALPLPPHPAASLGAGSLRQAQLDFLTTTLSHPRWLMARWLDRDGFAAAEARAWFNNAVAPLTLRVNPLKTSPAALVAALARHGVAVRPGRFAPFALVVTDGNPLATPLAHAGQFTIQDEASQLVAAAVGARPGERVFDCCASPGGKTTAMAADMEDRGMVVAADLRGRRVALLRQTVAESGASRVRIVRADARQNPPLRPVFDRVLLDAPCSGVGTLRRDPDLKWRRVEGDLARFAGEQAVMLLRASEAVRPGGRLVYATCSSEPDENERVVEAFLAERPMFRQFDLRSASERAGWVDPGIVNEAGYLETTPERHDLESFFAAVLERSSRPAASVEAGNDL